jgi:hypothetical protein
MVTQFLLYKKLVTMEFLPILPRLNIGNNHIGTLDEC